MILKLYMILVIFGQIHGVGGPLSISLFACDIDAASRTAYARAVIEEGRSGAVNGRTITKEDLDFFCVERVERPVLLDPYPQPEETPTDAS